VKLTLRLVFEGRVVCEYTTPRDVDLGERWQTPFTLSSDEIAQLAAYLQPYPGQGYTEVMVHR
jgi:hypothetical protein